MTEAARPATAETRLAYWAQGAKVIEAALAKVSKGNIDDAPVHLNAREAEIWLQAQASAYQHALEMMAPIEEDVSEDLLQRTIESTRAVLEKNG